MTATHSKIPDLDIGRLQTRVVGTRVVVLDVVDSTNTYALERGEAGDVIVADRQTAGRGRLGRTWFSAPRLGLWFTAVIPELIDGLTFAAALAVRDALGHADAVTVKWPNDILCHGRKVCGILAEHRGGRSALGIGINVHHRPDDFPEALRAKASSLSVELGETWHRGALLREVLRHLDKSVILLQNGGLGDLRSRFAAACGVVGRSIRVGDTEGRVVDLNASGGLIVESSAGPKVVSAGEIEYLD